MKNYRFYFDIKADNEEEAIAKLDKQIELNNPSAGMFSVEVEPFSIDEQTIILELASEILSDSEYFNVMADNLDIDDEELNKLKAKIEKAIN